MSKPADLVQGTLGLLFLKMLALEPMHGWAISQRLKQISGNKKESGNWERLSTAITSVVKLSEV